MNAATTSRKWSWDLPKSRLWQKPSVAWRVQFVQNVCSVLPHASEVLSITMTVSDDLAWMWRASS
jgi:hypothetical protein